MKQRSWRCWIGLGLMLLGLTGMLRAEVAPEYRAPDDPPLLPVEPVETRELGYWEATVLGVVEGITEYLPISSTGHLLLSNELLGLNSELPYPDATGGTLVDDEGTPYTLKRAADAYIIVIQGGAIIAVLIVFWRRVWNTARGSVGWVLERVGVSYGTPEANAQGFRLSLNLLVAFLPAAVLGLLLDDLIESYLFGIWPVVFALFAGAFLMFWVEARRKKAEAQAGTSDDAEGLDLPDLSYRQCLTIGFLQCVAMWPGTSRSMMTIVGGYLVGLNGPRAAEFSFLLGLITLTAASAYKLLKDGALMFEVIALGPMLWGILVATVSAALAVKWLVSYLSRHGLAIFAWYRIVLALALGAYFLLQG